VSRRSKEAEEAEEVKEDAGVSLGGCEENFWNHESLGSTLRAGFAATCALFLKLE
jgi:hypothetical protein